MPTISSTTTLTLAAGQAYVFLPGSGVGTAIADPGGRNAKYSIGPQQTAIGPFSTSVSVDVLITSGSIEYRVDTDGDLRDQDPAIAAQAAAIAAVEGRLSDALCDRATDVIAHRGFGALVAPENAMSSYRRAVSNGLMNIELDVCATSDGNYVCLHGPTVDDVTTGTGDISTLTAAQFKALECDPSNYLAAPAMLNEPTCTFDEAVAELAKSGCVLWPEVKTAGTGAGVVAVLRKHGIPGSRAVVQSFLLSDLYPAIDAGYGAAYATDPASADFEALKAAGVTHVLWSEWTDSQAAAAKAAGLKTAIYTLNRRVDWDYAKANGVDMVFSDDPLWISRIQPPTKRDPFWLRTWPSGFIGNTSSRRGMWLTGGEWAYNGAADGIYRGVLQGWACPVNNNEFEDTFTVDMDLCIHAVSNSTRFFGCFIGAADDQDFQDSASSNNGYHLLVRQSGVLDIYKKTGLTATKMATYTGSALTLEQFYKVRIAVTPTSITLSLPDVSGATVTLNDSAYRGGYFHFGQAGAYIRIKNVIVS